MRGLASFFDLFEKSQDSGWEPILMLYSGRPDINGVEICQSDLIEIVDYDGGVEIYEVCYGEGFYDGGVYSYMGFYLKLVATEYESRLNDVDGVDGFAYLMFGDHDLYSDPKIIGNIHENPDS